MSIFHKGKVLCLFMPLQGDPYSEWLEPDAQGFATTKKGKRIQVFVDPKKRTYYENMPQPIAKQPYNDGFTTNKDGNNLILNGED